MRPAIARVEVFDRDISNDPATPKIVQIARVVGPIDFEDADSPVAEHSVYLWVRIAPVSPHRKRPTPEGRAQDADQALATAQQQADAEGAEIGEQEETLEAVGTSEMERQGIDAAKKAVAAPSAPAAWSAEVTVEKGRLAEGDRVFVEVWALIRTVNRQREFQVYWYDDDVPVVEVEAPSAEGEQEQSSEVGAQSNGA